jgi:hypothetical protein
MPELAGGLIAVGVDGSPASVAALRWAADLARLSDAEIVVVRAWHVALACLAPYAPVSQRPTQEGERTGAEADLAGAMLSALGPAPDVKVRAALVCGPSAPSKTRGLSSTSQATGTAKAPRRPRSTWDSKLSDRPANPASAAWDRPRRRRARAIRCPRTGPSTVSPSRPACIR